MTCIDEVDLLREDLERDGFAGVKVFDEDDDLKNLRGGFWDWLENFDERIRRDQPETWKKEVWPKNFYGIIHGFGIAQAQFLWDIRQNAKVLSVFESLWGTQKLLVSFDGACFMVPPEYYPEQWKNFRSWAHIDQPKDKIGLHCYQGLVTLWDSYEQDGGLVVWRKSHKRVTDDLGPAVVGAEDEENLERICTTRGCERVKVCGPAGTLFLWDSRTVHCNSAPDPNRRLARPIPRAVAYVCMSPASLATPEQLQKKISAFNNMWGHGHDPCASAL
ncbi:hypothetical protein HDU93_000096 [Gonapodya sp. JEL0774]|nr:hypothetical protein HDU93_000096 [Gonapodya sp. JEL0774]